MKFKKIVDFILALNLFQLTIGILILFFITKIGEYLSVLLVKYAFFEINQLFVVVYFTPIAILVNFFLFLVVRILFIKFCRFKEVNTKKNKLRNKR